MKIQTSGAEADRAALYTGMDIAGAIIDIAEVGGPPRVTALNLVAHFFFFCLFLIKVRRKRCRWLITMQDQP